LEAQGAESDELASRNCVADDELVMSVKIAVSATSSEFSDLRAIVAGDDGCDADEIYAV